MGTKLAGVALAAGMACGWSGGAEAYPVKVVFSGKASGDFSMGSFFSVERQGFTFSDKPFVLQSFLDSSEVGVSSSAPSYLSIPGEFNVSFSFGNIYTLDTPQFFRYEVQLPHAVNGIPYDDFYDDFSVDFTFMDYRINYLGSDFFYIPYPNTLDAELYIYTIARDGAETWRNATFQIDAITLSTVPLPASAPLFGVAMLALGGIGYGLKRGQAVKAA